MATGIKDKVAIIGMGCTRFGERWDVGAEELMTEAFEECLAGSVYARMGEVIGDGMVSMIGTQGNEVVRAAVAELKNSWQEPLRW